MSPVSLFHIVAQPLRDLLHRKDSVTNATLGAWVASSRFFLVTLHGQDFEILTSDIPPPAGGKALAAKDIKCADRLSLRDILDVLTVDGLSRFSRLPLPLSNVGSPARYAQAVRLLSQIASAWAQPSSIWLSLDFEAESRLPENAPLGLARASDFGFRRTSWDVDGNRSERCGLWIDLTVKWPEDEQQEWEKNRFNFSQGVVTMCHGDEHENAIRDLVLTDIFSRKPLFLVMHGANMDVKWLQAKIRKYAPWTLPELGPEGNVTTVDTQYLYAALEMTTGAEPEYGWSHVSLRDALTRYNVCDPTKADLHNAGNDAYWTMGLLEAIVERARRLGCHGTSGVEH